MKTLGSLAHHKFKCVCVIFAIGISTEAHAAQPGGTSAGRVAQSVCQTSEREQELFAAIKQKNAGRLAALLAAGVSPNARSEINYDSDRPDEMSCATALMHAAHLGDAKAVELLLSAKADVSARDSDGRLVWAYALGYHAIRLIPPGWHEEEMNARLQITRALLAAGAQPDAKDQYGEGGTALFHAVDASVLTGDARVVKTLIAAGAHTDVKDFSILAYATRQRRRAAELAEGEAGRKIPETAETIRALLAAGANINGRIYGDTALMLEAGGWWLEGTANRLKILLAAGADVNAQGVGKGKTALLAALKYYEQYSFFKEGERINVRNQADIQRDQVEVVKLLLAAGADPNRKDKEGDAALHAAFSGYRFANFPSENEAIFKALIAAGADLNAKNGKGETVLLMAASERFMDDYFGKAKEGRLQLVKTLIAAGADVNLPNPEKQTPLLLAIKVEGTTVTNELIKTLLAAKADASTPDVRGRTPLIEAIATRRDVEIVEALLAAGAIVNARDKDGLTALLLASQDGWRPQFTRLLIAAGADVNQADATGRTPLMAAVASTVNRSVGLYNESTDIIPQLIAAKADVNAKARNGDTALLLAVKADREEKVVRALIAAGADVNVADDAGNTPLIVAASRYGVGRRDIVYYENNNGAAVINALVAAGARVKTLNRDGESALTLMAAKAGPNDLPVIRALLATGGRDEARDYPRIADLLAAIRRAAGHSRADIVQELITAGADVNGLDENGRPLLIVAVSESGNISVVRALLAAKARVNAVDKNGETALIAAVREYLPGGNNELVKKALRRDPEVVRSLLAAGADTAARDKDGYTALALAKKSGQQNIVGLLEAAGARR